MLVFPDRAAGPNKEEVSVRGPSPPGTHPILREVLVPDRSGKVSAQFPVSLYLQIKTDSHIHALIKPDREHTYNLKKIKTVPLEKNKQLPSTNKLHHVPKSYWFTLLHYLFSFE